MILSFFFEKKYIYIYIVAGNHEEEQAMELEALEAIYAEAFSITSEKPLEWKVHLEPTEGGVGEVNHGEIYSWSLVFLSVVLVRLVPFVDSIDRLLPFVDLIDSSIRLVFSMIDRLARLFGSTGGEGASEADGGRGGRSQPWCDVVVALSLVDFFVVEFIGWFDIILFGWLVATIG